MANDAGPKKRDEDGNVLNKDGEIRKPHKKHKKHKKHRFRKDQYGRPLTGRPRTRHVIPLKKSEFDAIEFFMQGMTKTDAMIKAGYSEKYAVHEQYKFFGREVIARHIEERRWQSRQKGNKITDRVQEELARIAFFNIGNIILVTEEGEFVYDFSETTMEEMAAIGEITVETYTEGTGEDAEQVKRIKVKPYDKKAALDSLARIHGMFNDRLTLGSEEDLAARLQKGRSRASAPEAIEHEPEYTDFEEIE